MRELDKKEKNVRFIVFLVLVGAVFLLLVARLFTLQVLDASQYAEQALQNRIRTNVIKATRGEIYDREGKLLAKNTTGYQVIHSHTQPLSPKDVALLKEVKNMTQEQIDARLSQERKAVAERIKETIGDINKISQITGYQVDYLIDRFFKQQRMGTDKRILVIEDLEKQVALRAIEKIDNDRIDIVEYNKRYYPEDSLASHVIGYVKPISEKEFKDLEKEGYRNSDLIGKKGVERSYDKEMKGQDGKENVEVDAKGNVIRQIETSESSAGKNVYLSIDLELQKYMTDAFIGKSGAFIAMEAKTGKIITFVSNPEISLNLLSSRIPDNQWNELVNSKAKPLVNKGIAGLYPPGSTFKAITGMGILESGISPYATVYSTGQYKYGNMIFRDSHKHGNGSTNFAKSIEQSVNTYYYVFSQKAGVEKIVKYAKEFGIGSKTGIDIPGELAGTLPSPKWKKKRFKKKQDQRWLPGDLINMSIGQGYVLTTPIQIASAYQAIANNGVQLKPTVVDRFVTYSGKVENNAPKVVRKLNVSSKNLKLMQNALRLPVSGYGGTVKLLRIGGYPVSAKTGTAQNTGFGDNHSWIAGYFPSDNPQIVFVSIVEGGGYGGVASGNMALKFILKYRDKYVIKKAQAEMQKKREEEEKKKQQANNKNLAKR
ncbi:MULTISPECIES: penicillin-binding protein 2 [unclassified Leptotrichia]|uniref:penicillin-binding protein 2 n=1 Tax=unclassified Leptotrichia TaxID=2633022 RepID=UPI0003FBEFF4|nr:MULTISPECIES: penicillin-binding protein 2 [unclassified Leptotrichia]WLD74571.1 penicillin-binding protein 2 [Leptotrichia sp. HMT-225]